MLPRVVRLLGFPSQKKIEMDFFHISNQATTMTTFQLQMPDALSKVIHDFIRPTGKRITITKSIHTEITPRQSKHFVVSHYRKAIDYYNNQIDDCIDEGIKCSVDYYQETYSCRGWCSNSKDSRYTEINCCDYCHEYSIVDKDDENCLYTCTECECVFCNDCNEPLDHNGELVCHDCYDQLEEEED